MCRKWSLGVEWITNIFGDLVNTNCKVECHFSQASSSPLVTPATSPRKARFMESTATTYQGSFTTMAGTGIWGPLSSNQTVHCSLLQSQHPSSCWTYAFVWPLWQQRLPVMIISQSMPFLLTPAVLKWYFMLFLLKSAQLHFSAAYSHYNGVEYSAKVLRKTWCLKGFISMLKSNVY